MSTFSIQQIRDELCVYLRYSDVLSTSVRGVTRRTEGYTVGVGGEAGHTFSSTPIKDFVYVTVDAVNKYYLRDYTMNWNTGVLTWNSALTNGQVVATQYDYGSGDKIYPDYPRDDITLTSYPRIAIELTSVSTQPLGLGGTNHISDFLITIYVWVSVNKDTNIAGGFGGLSDLNTTMYNIRNKIRSNAKSFYTFNWITPNGTSPTIKGTNSKILQQSQDFRIRFKVE